jgi:hypothetical protein
MSCFDDVLAAHTPLKHLGTTNDSVCATGFDEAMFLSGTSSNLWNEVNVTDGVRVPFPLHAHLLLCAAFLPLIVLQAHSSPSPPLLASVCHRHPHSLLLPPPPSSFPLSLLTLIPRTPQAAALAAASANFSTLLNATYPQPTTLRLDTSNFPNPFHGVAPGTFADSGETVLAMVDGGEDGQITPLQPMLVRDRAVDVLIAVDGVSVVSYFCFSLNAY